MNKIKKYTKEIEIYNTLYVTISQRGYFDDWLSDYDEVMFLVSVSCQTSQTLVKRIYWKKFVPNNKKMLDALRY